MLLAIDTALGACSAALMDGARLLAFRREDMARGHAEKLAPMVDAVMREAGQSFDRIACLAVTTGPGTFTGQRVGLAFVRALMVALKVPVIAMTTMEAMAEEADPAHEACVVIASDARREEIYLGTCVKGETRIEAEVLALIDAAQLLETLALKDIVLAGTASEMLAPILAKEGWRMRDSSVRHPDARFVARRALRLSPSRVPPKPLYLRAPDAKLPA